VRVQNAALAKLADARVDVIAHAHVVASTFQGGGATNEPKTT
jgi:maleate cis-trans isomerase